MCVCVCVYYPYMGLCMPWVPEDLILNKWIEMYLLSGYVYGMYIHTCMNTCVGIYYIAYAFPMNLLCNSARCQIFPEVYEGKVMGDFGLRKTTN